MLKKWLPLALKFLLSAVLIWFLLNNVDIGAALQRARALAPGMALAALALFLVQVVLATFRWLAPLRAIGAELPFARAFGITYIGIFFNQTLPSSVGGDAVRIYKAYKTGMGLGPAVNGVMLDRIMTVFALVLLVVVLQPVLLARIGDNPVKWVFPLLSLAAVAGVLVLMVLDRVPASLQRWKVVRGLGRLAADTRRLFLRPRYAARALLWSLLGHVNISLGVWCLALGLDLPVTALDCLVLVPPVILITTLPISIAGWGVREGAMVGAFGFIGVAPESALVMSILFGLAAVLVSLPGGVVWLVSGDRARGAEVEAVVGEGNPAGR